MLGSYPIHLTFLDLVVRRVFCGEYKHYDILSDATYRRYAIIIQRLSTMESKLRKVIVRSIPCINRWDHVFALTFTGFRILFRVLGKRTNQSVKMLHVPAVTDQTVCGGVSCADQWARPFISPWQITCRAYSIVRTTRTSNEASQWFVERKQEHISPLRSAVYNVGHISWNLTRSKRLEERKWNKSLVTGWSLI